MSPSSHLLRRVLWADAATSVASGALQLAAPDLLAGLLGLPQALLLETGVFFLAYGALVAWTASRREPPRALVLLFAFGNIAWAVACVGALAGPWLHPTLVGTTWVALQAAAVFAFGELQWWCARGPRGRAAT